MSPLSRRTHPMPTTDKLTRSTARKNRTRKFCKRMSKAERRLVSEKVLMYALARKAKSEDGGMPGASVASEEGVMSRSNEDSNGSIMASAPMVHAKHIVGRVVDGNPPFFLTEEEERKLAKQREQIRVELEDTRKWRAEREKAAWTRAVDQRKELALKRNAEDKKERVNGWRVELELAVAHLMKVVSARERAGMVEEDLHRERWRMADVVSREAFEEAERIVSGGQCDTFATVLKGVDYREHVWEHGDE